MRAISIAEGAGSEGGREEAKEEATGGGGRDAEGTPQDEATEELEPEKTGREEHNSG